MARMDHSKIRSFFVFRNTYGIYSIPETVFINADGSIYYTQLGAMSEKVLENYIKQIIGEEK